MTFKDKLEKAMQQLGITQAQLVGITGIGKSSVSQYLSGKNIPSAERQADIAAAIGLPPDYFEQDEHSIVAKLRKKIQDGYTIERLPVEDAAKLMGVDIERIRNGLQQGAYEWGYAVKGGEHKYSYFINAKRFAEIERIEL